MDARDAISFVLPHVSSVRAYSLWLQGPEGSKVVHDLVEVVDVEYVPLPRILVPFFEARRRVSSVLSSVFLHGLSESRRCAACVFPPFLVSLFHQGSNWM